MKPQVSAAFVLHFSSILVEVFNLIEILFEFATRKKIPKESLLYKKNALKIS